MGESDMEEIASIVKPLLDDTEATTITRGKNAGSRSKARFRTDADALDTARGRVADLLDRFPLYPELDLEYLQRHFG
jgi:glycine hydroxymethyltransferase